MKWKEIKGDPEGGKGGPPGPGKQNDNYDKGLDKNFKGDKSRRRSNKFDRIAKIDREMYSSMEGVFFYLAKRSFCNSYCRLSPNYWHGGYGEGG